MVVQLFLLQQEAQENLVFLMQRYKVSLHLHYELIDFNYHHVTLSW